MLEVKIENILPVTEARDSFNQLVDKVEGSDEMYVLTKNGKPVAILVGVVHLEKLTGTSHEELTKEIEDTEEIIPVIAETPAIEPVVEEAPAFTPAPAVEAPIESAEETPVAETPVTTPLPDDDAMQNSQDSAFSYDSPTAFEVPTEVPATPVAPAAPVVENVLADDQAVVDTNAFSMPPMTTADDQQAVSPEDASSAQTPPTAAV